MEKKADIGLIGLAVMGENLVMNMESKGYRVAVFNRTVSKVDKFISGRASGRNIIGVHSLSELAASLERPRKVILLVKAGEPVDNYINELVDILEEGDVIIDSGNSYFKDTIRRTAYVESKGLLFIGTGISGGEEGALKGPSLMPGGSEKAWPLVKDIFQAVAAKVDDGTPCCDWVGQGGAGHFVKMVHNGIEYGDMQLICEAYSLMRNLLGLSADELADVFADWNKTDLNSYLIEITSGIFRKKDEDGAPLIDRILDRAGQKGTGKWTCLESLDEGVPLTLIAEAVYSRCLSAMKDERLAASGVYRKEKVAYDGDRNAMIADIRNALLASKIISYAQGYSLMRSAESVYGWNLDLGSIALMWRGGCIIRSTFLGRIKEAFDADPGLSNLLLDPYFRDTLKSLIPSWRRVVAASAMHGIPSPAFSSALSYFDGYTSAVLPANLLQAQRDFFGAHTFERVDRERGEFFHANWTGEGGSTSASTYNA